MEEYRLDVPSTEFEIHWSHQAYPPLMMRQTDCPQSVELASLKWAVVFEL